MDKGWPELHPKASLLVSLPRDVLLLVETGLWGCGGGDGGGGGWGLGECGGGGGRMHGQGVAETPS